MVKDCNLKKFNAHSVMETSRIDEILLISIKLRQVPSDKYDVYHSLTTLETQMQLVASLSCAYTLLWDQRVSGSSLVFFARSTLSP